MEHTLTTETLTIERKTIMKNRLYGFNFLSLLVLICAVGCGNQIKVGGKVTFSDDGAPLTTGTVYFTTDAFEARGSLRADGTYAISSIKEGDGIPPGKYRIYVGDAFERVKVGEGENALERVIPLIAPKFASATDSGLEYEVNSSNRTFNFTVDRP